MLGTGTGFPMLGTGTGFPMLGTGTSFRRLGTSTATAHLTRDTSRLGSFPQTTPAPTKAIQATSVPATFNHTGFCSCGSALQTDTRAVNRTQFSTSDGSGFTVRSVMWIFVISVLACLLGFFGW
jgi:hypothetical protein